MARGLTISSTDRVLAVGRTGSGKTYLMERLTRPLTRLVVIDPKGSLRGRWSLDPWDGGRSLERGRARLHVTAPPVEDVTAYYEDVMATCYQIGNMVVYIDELYLINNSNHPGTWLRALYTTGRELGIGVWACTQRPVWVPLFCLSESDWFFVFRLSLQDDRRRMAEIVGSDVLTPVQHPHGLWLSHITWDRPRYYPSIK